MTKKPKTGRPRGKPSSTITLRHEKKIIEKVKSKFGKQLQEKGRDWLNKLAEEK